MSLYVTAFDGMGSGEDSLGGQLQNLAGIEASDIMHIANDFIQAEGVVDKSANDFLVTAAGVDMEVDVAVGIGYVENDDWVRAASVTKYWRVESDAIESVLLDPSNPTQARIDLIVLQINAAAVPDDEASNVASIEAVTGTPAGSPVPPAVPDNALVLAQVLVGAGVTTISNGNITDLRADTGLNNGWISAGETWLYSSSDDPTYTFTIAGNKTSKYSPGMRIRITQATGGTKYFIITDVNYSSPNTTITVYGGTDYDLNSETISDPFYSKEKSPYGFPLNPIKWSVSLFGGYNSRSSPTQNTWYNLGSKNIVVPIGLWNWSLTCTVGVQMGSNVANSVSLALATVNNGVTGDILGATVVENYGTRCTSVISGRGLLSLTSKTTYYLNERTKTASVSLIDNGGNDGGQQTVLFTSAYL